jgi:hypothetical protein
MSKNNNHNHKNGIKVLTTREIVRDFFIRRKKYNNKISLTSEAIPPVPPGAKINYLAIILDGEVQEIMRAQNRLAALLLSEPLIVEFNPDEIKPNVGWSYIDGKFSNYE